MATDANTISMYRGDSYPIQFTLRDKATGMALDLTGATLLLTVATLKDPPDNTTKLFDISGVLSATPMDGTVTFTPTEVNTSITGKFYYDVEMTQVGTVRTVLKSIFIIAMDITK